MSRTIDMVIPFGNHRGEKLSSLDEGYLIWIIEECEDEEISQLAQDVLDFRRDHPGGHF